MNTIEINQAVARYQELGLAEPISLTIEESETLAIVGPNAAGKSLLVEMIVGKSPLFSGKINRDPNIKYITFRDTYGSFDAGYYLQQRWNSTEYDDSPLVCGALSRYPDSPLREKLFKIFGMDELMDKPLVLLSSGELRKYQLTKILLSGPKILIVDNPFIGLDAKTREQLRVFFTEISSMKEIQLILVLSMLDDIPEFVTSVVSVEDRHMSSKMTRQEYLDKFFANDSEEDFSSLQKKILDLPYVNRNYEGDEVIRLNKVSVRYGERTILKDLDWVVGRGSKWALSGDNGSGKSTLLSLITADNPQGYACDISLFGMKRGTGESIWDIKKHIGYVSPEMHRAYCKNVPVIDIVSSGIHDKIGLYLKPKPEQMQACEFWMDVFGVLHLKDKSFVQISSGEQRLVLLARAFVKDPELLILDEPLHGLDTYNRRKVKKVIEAFCKRTDKTMIMVTHYKNELPSVITDSIYLVKNQ
ncbi:MAG: ATP-binding cassette domain-containing protein [Bacteroidales bacterium]|nr:ATP-binding cassette domain-containing protein [Bacteroidales bacterium]